MPLRAICFVVMPYGEKIAGGDHIIDFDAVYRDIIEPATRDVGFDPLRADAAISAGIGRKAMYERLVLSEYAIADLTLFDPGRYYELGVRHALRPQTTVLISAENGHPPFDVAHLRGHLYALDDAGKPINVGAARAALAERLRQRKTHEEADTALFQLLDGRTRPQVGHEKTDIFRNAVYSPELKEELRLARSKGAAALDAVRHKLGDIRAVEAGVVVDLLLSYRAVNAYDRVIEVYEAMEPVLARAILPREQYAFALNRAGRGEVAEQALKDLVAERGPSSETYGLLGRVYKDRWEAARKAGGACARGFLEKAIDAYLKGFETDWRDAYPGINAITLMALADPLDSRIERLTPVARYAVERKLARGAGDYWDHATLVELAAIAGDFDEAEDRLGDALASLREPWEAETTARNLMLIRDARREAGQDLARLTALIAELTRRGVKP